jgi:hypothetical protein
MPEDTERVSHGDILHAIGKIEGRLDNIHSTMANNRGDIGEAFKRIGIAEQRIAQGVIIAAAISLIMPVAVAVLSPKIHFGHPPPQASPNFRQAP